eukprot:712778-Prymnesium_polylepis.1
MAEAAPLPNVVLVVIAERILTISRAIKNGGHVKQAWPPSGNNTPVSPSSPSKRHSFMREASTESDIGGLNRAARPIVGPRLYMPGSLAACVYLVGETHIFVSKHNHGAKEVAAKLVSHLKAGSQASVAEYTPRLQTRSRTQSGQNQRSNC